MGRDSAMGARMAEAEVVDGLCIGLLRVASDPEQVTALYAMLGEYCHQVRNLLNSLKLSFYLVRRLEGEGGRLDELDRRYRELEGLVIRFQTICRPIGLTLMPTAIAILLQDRQRRWAERLERRAVELVLEPPADPVVARIDPIRMGEGLDALADWRAGVAGPGGVVRLGWSAEAGTVRLSWIETAPADCRDGPTVEDSLPRLALPLLARVVSAHGGAMEVGRGDGPEFHLSWPIDATSA